MAIYKLESRQDNGDHTQSFHKLILVRFKIAEVRDQNLLILDAGAIVSRLPISNSKKSRHLSSSMSDLPAITAMKRADLKGVNQRVNLAMISIDSRDPVILGEERLQKRLSALFLNELGDILEQSVRKIVITM
jgi:hypothetical protein